MELDMTRRKLLCDFLGIGTVAGLAGIPTLGETLQEKKPPAKAEEAEPEVTATEDLMREHGVIRRALLVYFESVPKIRQDASSINATELRQVAQLFRTFGEDYHEKKLEEEHIFPLVRKQGGELERYADILTVQHKRGRDVTDYVLAVTNGAKISAAHAEPLAKVLDSFVLMYANHAAREDTIVFPAWKKNFSNKRLDEIADEFEEIEQKMFGKDGFEDAEKKIARIEANLGFADLAQFTPPPPPKP